MKNMKIIILSLIALVAMNGAIAQNTNSMKKKTLVAYFSCTGNTKKAAEKLSQILDAELFEIVPQALYTPADLDWRDKNSRSTVEMNNPDSRPAIASKVAQMEQYDTVFIGFPIWWYVAPTIINTFIESYDLSGKVLVTFATSGSSGIENCDKNLQKTYPKLQWRDGKLLNGAFDEATIKKWIEKL